MLLAKTIIRNAGSRGVRILSGVHNPLFFRTNRTFSSSFRGDGTAIVSKLVNDPKFMSAEENRRSRWPVVIEEFARFPGDTGSPEVQVALLTERVRYLTEHFRPHKKDKHGLKGLRAILNRRTKLLLYLRRKDADRYFSLIKQLGLKDRLSDRLI